MPDTGFIFSAAGVDQFGPSFVASAITAFCVWVAMRYQIRTLEKMLEQTKADYDARIVAITKEHKSQLERILPPCEQCQQDLTLVKIENAELKRDVIHKSHIVEKLSNELQYALRRSNNAPNFDT